MTAAASDPALAWLDYLKPFSAGLVVAPQALRDLGLDPIPQRSTDTVEAAALIDDDEARPALPDPWAFFESILGWEERHVAGSPGGPAIPDELVVRLPEHGTTLAPTLAVRELRPSDGTSPWQLLVQVEAAGIESDARGALDGWEATAHQRFERLLRETGVPAGLLVTDRTMRLVHAPKGETSGWLGFPSRALATVAGRPMLGGLKLVLDRARLFTDAENRRLPALLKASREAQAGVSTALAEQVLGALHELLRGLDAAAPGLVRDLARDRPSHLYEGLLAVLMRLVFILYAEDRNLLPSRTDARARELYEGSYSLRGLYAKLVEDAALNPDTMDDRRGGWGRMLALFRLIHAGHPSGFVRARGGKLFDPSEFPFLEGRAEPAAAARVLPVSDACVLRVLEGLMTLQQRGGVRERLSYRTLDVQEIGSVYQTIIGFTATIASGRVLAIKAGKNNRTPVYSDLDELLTLQPKERLKDIRENMKRGQLSAGIARAVEAARDVEELAAALDPIVDPRASPKGVAGPGTPILQPTEERRRTGSHYTPPELTGPIVHHALEPVFEGLGDGPTPKQILDLKVCDPAMGSGAFLVGACRQIGARLVKAWAMYGTTPKLPLDQDEELHARREVARHCLYGVDKNALATDLAKLSLWLETLASDHEFTFLDHALKEGDSLVGLSVGQIKAAHWDPSKPGLPLFRQLVDRALDDAIEGRQAIREAGDDVLQAAQAARNARVGDALRPARLLGDAVIAAFFAADKPKARERKRQEVEAAIAAEMSGDWATIERFAHTLGEGEPHERLRPFHWELEFPEVFAPEKRAGKPGFDAIVGNPPFAGKNTTIAGNRTRYVPWLQTLHKGAHGNADLVAHFFRRAFTLLRQGGVFGLIATNTIGQGDTRDTGLATIIAEGGAIARAMRRLKWPGEAAVVVSVVHVVKDAIRSPVLDGRQVRRVSAYLVEGDLDRAPARLVSNSRKAFQGSIVLGMGFTFDDAAAAKGEAESIDAMRALIAKDARNAERIFPFIGGEEVTTSPTHAHHRYIIDFFDRPLERKAELPSWAGMSDRDRERCLTLGVVPSDYPGEVAADWPDLIDIVRRRVKADRNKQTRDALRVRWWQYAEKRPGLYNTIAPLHRVVVNSSKATPHHALAFLSRGFVYSQNVNVLVFDGNAALCALQARAHEVWARFVGTSMKDDFTYVKDDCFETFPFPPAFETAPALEAAGAAYYDHRAALMLARGEGMTKTYNRFHDSAEQSEDIVRLRDLHAEMDRAVLRTYDWCDLADRADPVFLDEATEDDHTYQGRLFWPSAFRDEVLSRLLSLNADRAADERAQGQVAAEIEDDLIQEHEAA